VDAEELAFAGIARQAELIRAGEVSSRELVDLYLERIERLNPKVNAFTEVLDEWARAEADSADGRRASGEQAPLLGVPVAIKDIVDVEGIVTQFGTRAFDAPATADGEMVARLRRAGAVVLGKTTLPELAICGFTESKGWVSPAIRGTPSAAPAARAAAALRPSPAGWSAAHRPPMAAGRSASRRPSAASSA
jgi:amidase